MLTFQKKIQYIRTLDQNDIFMEDTYNPFLTESQLPFGAPEFDKIRKEHYLPAFKAGIKEAKAEIDAITDNPAPADFGNTIEALEFCGRTLDRVSDIFFNLLEADTDDTMQAIAEEVSPMLTEYSMYVSLNERLFERVKAVYEQRDRLCLEKDRMRLLENTYKAFTRSGAALGPDEKAVYSKYMEELSLLSLQFGKNVLEATNAFFLHLDDEQDLDGLPGYVRDMGRSAAEEKGLEGYVYTLEYPSYSPFMKFCSNRDLRRRMYMAQSTRAFGGEHDNSPIVRRIAELRRLTAGLLGYGTYADYALEDRMAKSRTNVDRFLSGLLTPTLPYAEKEISEITAFARENGFEGQELQPWDFSYWAERYQETKFSLNEEMLKPYFRLEDCIGAVLGLAERLYGLRFLERDDLPVYHKDVKVFDVTDSDGRHLALFYADFFPRASKRGGAWMTEFRGQCIRNGIEERPFISIVTNFTKPAGETPSLLTHSELTTFLHEFGHALHGIMAEGRYPSLTGTNVARDFVELPSQIMENWAYEPEYLDSFARDYRNGSPIPAELIDRIIAAKNYLAGYQQVRQLQFGILDMAWHSMESVPESIDVQAFEQDALDGTAVLPRVPGTAISTSFGHIFSGGYAAGYYSYKWAEVLEADAFSRFKDNGIFNKETAASFRENILSKGDTEDPAVLYRNFMGRDPEPDALMKKLGLGPMLS